MVSNHAHMRLPKFKLAKTPTKLLFELSLYTPIEKGNRGFSEIFIFLEFFQKQKLKIPRLVQQISTKFRPRKSH